MKNPLSVIWGATLKWFAEEKSKIVARRAEPLFSKMRDCIIEKYLSEKPYNLSKSDQALYLAGCYFSSQMLKKPEDISYFNGIIGKMTQEWPQAFRNGAYHSARAIDRESNDMSLCTNQDMMDIIAEQKSHNYNRGVFAAREKIEKFRANLPSFLKKSGVPQEKADFVLKIISLAAPLRAMEQKDPKAPDEGYLEDIWP